MPGTVDVLSVEERSISLARSDCRAQAGWPGLAAEAALGRVIVEPRVLMQVEAEALAMPGAT